MCDGIQSSTMAEQDPYRVLGVSKGATDAEIKRAFRKKARQFHPDRNSGDAGAEAKFKQVQSAYEKIGSLDARREYDQQQQMANMFGGGGFRSGNGLEDMLGQMFGGGGRYLQILHQEIQLVLLPQVAHQKPRLGHPIF